MNPLDLTPEEAISVRCPVCGAGRGTWCPSGAWTAQNPKKGAMTTVQMAFDRTHLGRLTVAEDAAAIRKSLAR